MNIVYKKIAELKFANYNPRKLSPRQAEDLRKSLQGFGIVEPAVVNSYPGRENIVVGGEQRIRQAKQLKYKEFPCYEVNLPLEKEKELNVRLNKNTGEWDMLLLEEHFRPEELISWGFESTDLVSFKSGVTETTGDDDIPDAPEKVKSKRGDLYELNGHRLLCGDSTIKAELESLVGKEGRIKLIFTSPPYNMKSTLYSHYKDNRQGSDFVMFNFNVLTNWKRYLERGGFVFWNMSYNKNSGPSFLEVYYQFVKHSGLVFLEDIVWDKGHGMPLAEQLTRQYEHLLVLNESLENIHFIDHIGVFGTMRIPFIKDRNKGLSNYWRVDTFKSQSEKIKAAFPVELPTKAIEICTREGEVVADCFGGSGSTLIAAEKSGRRALLMELDPSYCDLIITRFIKFCQTNEKAYSVKLNGEALTWE